MKNNVKRFLILILVTLLLTSGLLLSCSNETNSASTPKGLEERIETLETKLTEAESTIMILEQRIEELENSSQGSLNETDVLRTLQGKTYWANVGGQAMQIQFWECKSLNE